VTDSAVFINRNVAWRLIAAVTLLALTMSVVAGILLLRSHEAAEGGFDRMIPVGGVTSLSYGSSPVTLSSGSSEQRVALVSTPGDATNAADTDWTWIMFDPVSNLGDGGSDRPRARNSDGLARLSFPVDSGGSTTIVSARFDARSLETAIEVFAAAGSDVDLIAHTIISWSDDLDLVWSGHPVVVDAVVMNGSSPADPDNDSQAIGWIDSSDGRRYAASFRPFIGEDSTGRASVFQLPVVVGLTENYLSIPATPPPVSMTEPAWFSIISELVGDHPEVHLTGGFLMPDPSYDITDVDVGSIAEVMETEHDYTVALRFATPLPFHDPIRIFAVVGDSVTLRFDLLYGSAPRSVVSVPSRMSRREARLWVDLINSRDSRTAQG